jgi:hypothetical protein
MNFLPGKRLIEHIVGESRCHHSALYWGLPLVVAGLLCAVYLTGDLFGDELITYEWASKGTALLETGKPPNLLNIDIMLSRFTLWIFNEPWALRVPSFIFALLTVFMVGRLGQYLAGRQVGLISLWLAAFSPMLIEFAAEGRPYTIYSFFSVWLIHCLLRFIQQENVRSGLLLAICAVLGCLSRTFFVANLTFAGLLYFYRRRAVTRYSAAVALSVLPFVIRLYLVSQHYAAYAPRTGADEPGVSLPNFLARGTCAVNFGLNLFALPQLGLARNIPLTQVLLDNAWVAMISGVGLFGLAVAVILLIKKERRVACLLTAACIIPASVLIMLGLGGYSIIREKYLIGILGPYLVLLALLSRRLATTPWGWGVILCFVLANSVSLGHYFFKPEIYSRRAFVSRLDSYLQENASVSDVAITYHFVHRPPGYIAFFDRADRAHIDLYNEVILKGLNLVEFAHKVNQDCQGRIYLICDEGTRLWLDHQGDLIRILGEARISRSQNYGRNLRLYVFGRRPVGNPELSSAKNTARAESTASP